MRAVLSSSSLCFAYLIQKYMLYCCLLRRFNHNYYASNHHIAEDHFPIFVRRVIQMAKVIARRPKLFMNEMSPFKKVHHKMCVQVWNRTRYSWLIIKRIKGGDRPNRS